MGQRLGGLKTKLDETTAQVGPSKECEDVGVLHKALKSLEDHEDELAMARQPLGRCWALLEFGNVAHVMTPQVHAVREGVGKQQQAAHRLSADIAAKRTEYKEQATELRRVRKLRECHQPWYMAWQASKLIPRMIRLRSLQARAKPWNFWHTSEKLSPSLSAGSLLYARAALCCERCGDRDEGCRSFGSAEPSRSCARV